MYAREKRYCRLYLIGLIILAGMAGLTGCSSSDETVEDNPSYNPVEGTVKIPFVLSVATTNGASTRMSDANTQSGGTAFRGITDAQLLTYQLDNDGQSVLTTTNALKLYPLVDITGLSASNAKRVMELELKLNTNAVMFYGRALKTEGQDKKQGKILYNVSTTASETKFQLQPRLTAEDKVRTETGYDAQAGQLAAILNGIIVVSSGGTTWLSYYQTYKNSPSTMPALAKELGRAYDAFYTIPTGEARSGSGSAVLRMAADLWKVAYRVQNSTNDEATAKEVATAIITQLSINFEYNTETEVCTFQSNNSSLATFPTSFGLPAGAAQLEINSSGQFAYKDVASLSATSSISNIMWPAELCYYGNSPIRCSTAGKLESDYPSTVTNWTTASSWTSDWTDKTHIAPSTRAVAMRNPVNYGTAMLKTTVRYGAASLEDKNAVLHTGEVANIIDATNSPFELTGVLIGGQYNQVGWNYLPMSGSTADYTIYDNDLSNEAKTIPAYTDTPTASAPNYTLVFDNYLSNVEQSDVYVCLEFKNNSGSDFYGNQNLIGKGQTFYLIGKLELDDQNVTILEEKATPNVTRVFIQDYVTEANFVIGANSLKYAFVTVPDLRASQISLGMAVDLEWSTGPTYSGIVLGGED